MGPKFPDTTRPEAVSPERAAILWSVSRSTILRLIHRKQLPAYRVGRQWRIKLIDLRRLNPN